jgi:micrococcal nuclease
MPRSRRNKSRSRSPYRRRRRGGWSLIIAIVIALLILADRNGWLLTRADSDLPAYHGRWAKVERIIDGDTIDIALPDSLNDNASTTRVRLWGIDCPEMAHFDQIEEPWARQASEFATGLVAGHEVMLMLEPQRERDSYGRVLAHVEMRDGRSLNEALLEAGFARADDRWPHARLTRYAQVELAARRAKTGVWSETSSP